MRAVNLIPADQRGGASLGAGRSEGVAYAVPVLLAGLAVLAFVYGTARHQISSRTAQAASISSQVAQANSEAAKLATYSSYIALREQRATAVAELVNARFDWAHGFHELGRVLPSGVWLTAINGQVGSSAPSSSSTAPAAGTVTSSTPAGSVPTFSLNGCASSQAQVALTLDRLRLIDGVSAVSLEASGGNTAGAPGSAACKTSFTALLTFEALPSTATVTAATASKGANRTVANTTGGGK
jgi:Tfp pilus assembly protein PilN